jgi:hypothetical protein
MAEQQTKSKKQSLYLEHRVWPFKIVTIHNDLFKQGYGGGEYETIIFCSKRYAVRKTNMDTRSEFQEIPIGTYTDVHHEFYLDERRAREGHKNWETTYRRRINQDILLKRLIADID